MSVGTEVGEAVGDGVVSDAVVGEDGIRVELAVPVAGVSPSTCAVAVATLVVPAVLPGVAAGEVVVAVGEAGSRMSDESLVQAASNNSPAASNTSATAGKGRTIDNLLAITGLPLCR